MRLEDIKGCAVSVKDNNIIVLISGKGFYEKIEFENKGKIETFNLNQSQYIRELERNCPYYHGRKN